MVERNAATKGTTTPARSTTGDEARLAELVTKAVG